MSTLNGSAEYDLIVLGGGAVGENIADRAVQGGQSGSTASALRWCAITAG